MPWRRFTDRFFKKREDPLLPITEEAKEEKNYDTTVADGSFTTDNEKYDPADPAWTALPTIPVGAHARPEIIVTAPEDDSDAPPSGTIRADDSGRADYERDLAQSAVYRPRVFSNPFGDDQQSAGCIGDTQGPPQKLKSPSQPALLQPAAQTAQIRNFSKPTYASSGTKITWLPDPNVFPADYKRRQSSWGQDSRLQRPAGRGRQVSTISTLSVQSEYPRIVDPVDPARKLSHRNLVFQRIMYLGIVVTLNIGCLMAALFSHQGLWVFVFILVIKSKDVLSALLSPIAMMIRWVYRLFKPLKEVPPKWILSLIPAYSESEEQIVKCIFSLRDNGIGPHRQVMCVVLDGKPRDVKSRFTKLLATIERPYVSFKHRLGELRIHAGFMEDVPVIIIEKKRNAGKKDSLILAHDLFNFPRKNVPLYTELLRTEIWQHILPDLTDEFPFGGFDMIFCTDADSVIHRGALSSLCNALAREENSIAACGLVLVELEPGREWSAWNMYQQFQYCFGQFVRRRAEHFWGKVTCLPGCITMIKCRPECAGAIAKYAEPVTTMPVLHHQVQYLGTDRRLTYCLLSQNIKLTTLFVPEAVSETVAPQSLKHYLSQRRRWGSNAYFNNYFYMTGEKMSPITRVAAFIEVLRLSMVYYRFCNTILLIREVIVEVIHHKFSTARLIPLLAVSQFPLMWFCISVLIEKQLRCRAHKLLMGFCINKGISSFVSMFVFWSVCRNVGSQVWGISGITAAGGAAPTSATAGTAASVSSSAPPSITSAAAGATPMVTTAGGVPAIPAVPVVPAAPLVKSVRIEPSIPGAPAFAAVAVPLAAPIPPKE
ncbi:hypothetical protein A1O1_06850 [Capronia coronata CBS 617.96]|uniref:chitin synthase n=1 Tax=Capronia coronata CBS 617.96 TaxID=1182541 RepID=W9Y1W4_9EURO|nr:uncharacterized protein A1O1_06850 [Capronia coronata CBS 617.96]EXJ83231.1 hypothetical protein A1O1_06850 [Capronia coronata CBS 617.96]